MCFIVCDADDYAPHTTISISQREWFSQPLNVWTFIYRRQKRVSAKRHNLCSQTHYEPCNNNKIYVDCAQCSESLWFMQQKVFLTRLIKARWCSLSLVTNISIPPARYYIQLIIINLHFLRSYCLWHVAWIDRALTVVFEVQLLPFGMGRRDKEIWHVFQHLFLSTTWDYEIFIEHINIPTNIIFKKII